MFAQVGACYVLPMRPGFRRYLRFEVVGLTLVSAACLGFILAGNHTPAVIAVGVLGVIVVLGDRFVLRR